MSWQYDEACDLGYDGPDPSRRTRSAYNCGGWANYHGPCGATDCINCYPGGACEDEPREYKTSYAKVVTARKRRRDKRGRQIEVGDTIKVISGFTYEEGGPRTGYFRRYQLLAKGKKNV